MQPDDQQKSGNWTFHNEDEANVTTATSEPAPQDTQPASEPVTWTASEFIAHHKDPGWYLLLAGSILALCGLVFIFTQDIISVVAIAVVVILYLIITNSKPRQRSYTVTEQGISIDDKFYPFNDFKSFTVSQEGAIGCVTFLPLKRLMPELTIYFAPNDADRIIDNLARSLPNDQRKDRAIDRLIQKLHL